MDAEEGFEDVLGVLERVLMSPGCAPGVLEEVIRVLLLSIQN